MHLSLCFANCPTAAPRNRFLNVVNGIKSLSQPLPILYSLLVLFFLLLVSRSIKIPNLMLLKIYDFTITVFICLSYLSPVPCQFSYLSCCISCIGFFVCAVCLIVLLHFNKLSGSGSASHNYCMFCCMSCTVLVNMPCHSICIAA